MHTSHRKTDYSHPNKVPVIFEVSFQLLLTKENTKIPDQIAVTQLLRNIKLSKEHSGDIYASNDDVQ